MSTSRRTDAPRVLLLTRDALYPRDFLRGLMGDGDLPCTLVGVGLSTRAWRRGGNGRIDSLRDVGAWVQRVGVPYALYMAWVAMMAPVLLRARPSPVAVARRAHAPVRRIADVNDAATRRWIAQCAPDLILTVHWNQWVAPETAALATDGGVNVHPSPLPAYRGVDPVHMMLRAKEHTLGCTLHRIAPGIDAGAIVAQHHMTVRAGGRVPNNRALFHEAGLLARTLLHDRASLRRALAAASPQPMDGASYHGWDAVRG